MQGILTFHNMADAIKAGYQEYDKTPTGYLVRTRTAEGWALAIVELKAA